MERLSLIDVASEDDLLLTSPSSAPQLPDPSPPGSSKAAKGFQLESIDAQEGEILDLSDPMDQVPELSESPKQKKAKSSFNLRKSLAWDSAFFTSEGVLNTEELGIVNSTFRKAEASASKLPEIPEETRRSGESTSTLDNESWVLENGATELFDNVRASIQRSLGKSDKVRSTDNSSKTPRGINASRLGLRQKVDRTSQNKIKLHPSTSQGVITKQRPDATPKVPPVARVASLGPAESKASSRPPRILPKAALPRVPSKTAIASGNSDKRSSTGGVLNRQPVGKSANSSASVTSRSVGAPKCGSNKATSGTVLLAAPSTYRSISIGGTTSDSTPKSLILSNKKRSAQRIAVRSSSGSTIISKDNPVRTSRNKIPTRSQGGASFTDPTIKCPSISPTSSVDSMVSVISEASSSASTAGKSNNTTESFDVRSYSSPYFVKSNSRPPIMKLRPSTIVDNAASGVAASGDHSKNSTNTSTQGKGFKPSGLRMPTPKIGYFVGYFDAEKSVERNVDASSTKLQYSRPAIQKPQLSSTQITKPASIAIDQQESKPATTAHKENDAYQSQNAKEVQVQKDDFTNHLETPMKAVLKEDVIPPKVNSDLVAQEACIDQNGQVVAAEIAKENISTSNQNIQPNDLSTLTVELMSQKLSSISLLETTDLVS